MKDYTYDKFAPDDRESHDDLMRQAFGTTSERNYELRQQTGEDNIRVVRQQKQVIGAITCIQCGQYFRGQSVPVTFLAGASIASHLRNQKIGTYLFSEIFKEYKARQSACIILGAALLPFYRKLGFEFGHSRLTYGADIDKLHQTKHQKELLKVEPVNFSPYPFKTNSHLQHIEHIYKQIATNNNGLIDRNAYFWQERLAPIGKVVDLFLLLNQNHEPEGYLALNLTKNKPIQIRDWGALTQSAARTILHHLANYSSNWKQAYWFGSHTDMLAYNIPERDWRLTNCEDLMIRIIDVERALTSRGYSPDIQTQLSLKVHDPLIVENNDQFILSIQDGHGTVERKKVSSLPYVECDVAGLSGLFSSHLPTSYLQCNGRLTGDQKGMERLGYIFAGPKPWMQDIF